MMTPTIHLNGTSRTTLLEALCDAEVAIDAAYRALKHCAPNGRDYYPQGPHALQEATNEHLDRLQRLDEIKAEVTNLIIAIDEA